VHSTEERVRRSLLRGPVLPVLLLLLGSLPQPAPAGAQAVPTAVASPQPHSPGTKAWVGREAEYEQFLKTVRVKRYEDIPIGVTRPKRAFFEPGGLAASGAWKPLQPGIKKGFWESYKSEIAAYELDKLLGLQMVPPAVERVLEREYGALILWLENVKGWKPDEDLQVPDGYLWAKQAVRRRMFDNLIGNGDRNQGNLLYDEQFNLILIDHSRALTTSRSMPSKLVRFDRALWDRMDALTYEALEPALSPWMGKREIRAILTRRDKMREELAALLAKASPYAVFMR
jgi:hypothetical protein